MAHEVSDPFGTREVAGLEAQVGSHHDSCEDQFQLVSRQRRADAVSGTAAEGEEVLRTVNPQVSAEDLRPSAVFAQHAYQPIEVERFVHHQGRIDLFGGAGTEGRHHDHWDVGDGGIFFLGGAKLPSGHYRHIKVQQDDFGSRRLMEIVEGLFPVARRRDPDTFQLQTVRQRFASAVVVLDNQHAGLVRLFGSRHMKMFGELVLARTLPVKYPV